MPKVRLRFDDCFRLYLDTPAYLFEMFGYTDDDMADDCNYIEIDQDLLDRYEAAEKELRAVQDILRPKMKR